MQYQISTFKVADPAGTKFVVELQNNVQTDNPVAPTPEGTRKRLKRERNPVWCHIIHKNVGSGSLQELLNLLEDAPGTLSS